MTKLRPFWKVITWTIMIVVLSGFPGKSLVELFSWDKLFSFDKLAHAIIYFIQMLLLMQALRIVFPERSMLYCGLISFLVTVSFGILMELLQAYVFSDRSGDVMDVLANSFGSLMAFLYILARNRVRNKKHSIH
jgi:VanZ family protein